MNITENGTSQNRIKQRSTLASLLKVKEFGTSLALICLILAFSLASPTFLTITNLINIVRQISILGILAIGMTMVIVSGEIDLSIGSVYGMCAMIAGVLMTNGVPIWVAVFIALLAGIAAGIINGFLVTRLRVPALIVTLGMLNMARGVAFILTGGMVVTLTKRLIKDPALDSFIFLGRGETFGLIPTMTIAFIIVIILGYLVYQRNILGYRMRAIGGNPDAARVSGINVELIKIVSFAITGFLAAFGGIINFAFLNNVQPTMGQGFELDVIAATILGGASLSGGEGTIIGTVIGVLILGVLRNGLVLISVSPFLQMIIIGAVLIGAVAIDMLYRRK